MNKTAPPLRLVGYARVSTVGQTLEAQLEQLEAAGCEVIYQEKASGARDDRKQLVKMLKNLREGDLVVVTRTDRLARSIFQMFRIVSQIVDAGANFRDLAQPLADTSTSSGRMYLAILGGLAEIERELIASRTAEGRARSTKRMGRPFKLTPAQQAEALERKASGEPLTDIARSYNVSHMTIQRLRPPV
ncbi:recombinase family protein [Rhizobium sp. PP-CC-3G-465]|uniref:recombinase family protein n=1 Tax=Rhizobium sp. PP-CC-3G-465 TaxID=2135648 RepID=UPI00104DEBBA|nr:DNA invertase Pin-like site-specific DNA recombinase [Rhizobium sp. PP-CC-3G-465]